MLRVFLIVLFILFSFDLFCADVKKLEFVYVFFSNTEYKDVADIIAAQGALESGWYKNKAHVHKNNYFSILDTRKKNCHDNQAECMLHFSSLEDNCKALLAILRKNGYRVDRDGYLEDLEYGPNKNRKLKFAIDPHYTKKIYFVLRSIHRRCLIGGCYASGYN